MNNLTDTPQYTFGHVISDHLNACTGRDFSLDGHPVSPNVEWPMTSISRFVVYDDLNGIFQNRGAARMHISSEEVDLCRNLSNRAQDVLGMHDIGMGSAVLWVTFAPFWLVALKNEETAPSITPDLIRQRFTGSLFPPLNITVEPIQESGVFWDDVEGPLEIPKTDPSDVSPEVAAILRAWRRTMKWFNSQVKFIDRAFVYIGDEMSMLDVPESDYPPGTEAPPCVFPRLILGLTERGSLAGLFTHVVQA